jgi:GntR family transcriptional repressor for pyruvate dehydrogenase complex
VSPGDLGGAGVRRVRKAYEQVADQLRELIVNGDIRPGHRLPNEAALSVQFGVSRATVREALRVLSTQSLIRTTKGATGGSFVIMPTADHISEFLSANISLLSQTETVSLDEFLELREFLEVPAARLAARRHAPEELEGLREAIPADTSDLGTEEQFIHNKDFHSRLVLASGNALLSIAAQPIFSVLQTNLSRSNLGRRFHRQINADHQAIAAAVAAGDEDAAAAEMHRHLAYLRPFYEKAWRTRNSR